MSDTALPQFPMLDVLGDIDVVIVGGGLSGLTAGLLLQRAGYRTAILEQSHLGSGETGRTSAHLTVFPDAGFTRLVSDFGLDSARAVAESKREAISQIELLAREAPCDFVRVSGYLFSEDEGDRSRLANEAKCCADCGVAAHVHDRAPLQFATTGAMEVPNQAQFHPFKYLAGLVRLYAQAGGTISELTHVRAVDEANGDCRVRTERATVTCEYVIVVTDAPITGGALLDTKLRANRSYIMAVRMDDHAVPNGLFWDTDEPYHYIRTATTSHGTVVLIGGEDHRVGTDSEAEAFASLARYARDRFPVRDVVCRWSGQIMEPVDGLPYIGPRAENSHVMVGTGYSGNGVTFGTVAARVLADIVATRVNPYAELYAPTRPLGARQWAKYAAQNLPAAWTLVTDMLPLPASSSIDDLKPGEGRLLRIGGEKAAAARDRNGVLHVISPTCTHMGCEVAWNDVEQTWDCPCHGSRYHLDGTVLHGPATAPLESLSTFAGSGDER